VKSKSIFITLVILTAILAVNLLTPVYSGVVVGTAVGAPRKIVVAVDLAHGESDKYLNYIMGNITFVEWKLIQDQSISSELLESVDVLLIGQPQVAFSVEEMDAIKAWLEKGNKVLYIAGDSDYGPGPTRIDVVNTLLDYIGAKLRLEQAAVYSDVNQTYTYKGNEWPTCANATYRMLAFIEPDPVQTLSTWILDYGVTKPILMHGPTAVIWVDEDGNYRDPVNETFPGLIRIAWFRNSYIADNNPPSPYLYSPLFYGQGFGWFSFVGYAAEYWSDKNVLITVAGESLYGDYEPAWASLYPVPDGVPLDGPRFVTNLFKWWIKVVFPEAYSYLLQTPILIVPDPVGDDNGTGTLLYPTNPVFVEGVYDLVKFSVYEEADYIFLQVDLRNLGGNPWNGPNGFSLQHIQIYILTTSNKPVNKTTYGLGLELEPGWHYAVVAIPGWGDVSYPDGEVSALFDSSGVKIADECCNASLFDVYALANTNTIEVKIAKSLIGDLEGIYKWVWYVFVASYDGFAPMKVRPVTAGDPQEWVIGGGDAKALAANIQPKVLDLLAPTPDDQYAMLKSYDVEAKKPASVYGFAVSLYKPPVTEIVTQTVTQAVTETITTTTTAVTTTTVEKTVTQPDVVLTAIVAVVTLIIGLGIGMFIKKPAPSK